MKNTVEKIIVFLIVTSLLSGRAVAEEFVYNKDLDKPLAVITQSGSTNASGYRILLRENGSAAVTLEGNKQMKIYPSVNVNALRATLQAIGDMTRLPVGGCAKSTSFGTATKVTYNNTTSGDLQCLQKTNDAKLNDAGVALNSEIADIVSQLKIDALTRREPRF